jgi:ankyrin repeat protein
MCLAKALDKKKNHIANFLLENLAPLSTQDIIKYNLIRFAFYNERFDLVDSFIEKVGLTEDVELQIGSFCTAYLFKNKYETVNFIAKKYNINFAESMESFFYASLSDNFRDKNLDKIIEFKNYFPEFFENFKNANLFKKEVPKFIDNILLIAIEKVIQESKNVEDINKSPIIKDLIDVGGSINSVILLALEQNKIELIATLTKEDHSYQLYVTLLKESGLLPAEEKLLTKKWFSISQKEKKEEMAKGMIFYINKNPKPDDRLIIQMINDITSNTLDVLNTREEKTGDTLLLSAIKKNLVSVVDHLLPKVSLKIHNDKKESALYLASQHEDNILLKRVIDHAKQTSELNWLYKLFVKGVRTDEEKLINKLISIMKPDRDFQLFMRRIFNKGDQQLNYKLLKYATNSSSSEMLDILFDSADMKQINYKFMGKTPLHIAIEDGDDRLLVYCIEKKADITIIDGKGDTPIDLIIQKKDPIILSTLINNSDQNINFNEYIIPAAQKGLWELVALMLLQTKTTDSKLESKDRSFLINNNVQIADALKKIIDQELSVSTTEKLSKNFENLIIRRQSLLGDVLNQPRYGSASFFYSKHKIDGNPVTKKVYDLHDKIMLVSKKPIKKLPKMD